MSEAKRWVVVDSDLQMVGGPYLWDGHRRWTPPEKGKLVLEADWLASQPAPGPEPE